MDTKKAQIRFELLTVARTASFTMVYLALQIWGFFSRKAIESTKKASDFVRCLKIRDRIIAPNRVDRFSMPFQRYRNLCILQNIGVIFNNRILDVTYL